MSGIEWRKWHSILEMRRSCREGRPREVEGRVGLFGRVLAGRPPSLARSSIAASPTVLRRFTAVNARRHQLGAISGLSEGTNSIVCVPGFASTALEGVRTSEGGAVRTEASAVVQSEVAQRRPDRAR